MKILVALLFILSHVFSRSYSPLDVHFYKQTCPQAESVINQVIANTTTRHPRVAPALLRLSFHDCFVQGCDASILIDSPTAEKTASVNRNIAGYPVIDAAKTAVEDVCPGVVSCADILALAARDAVQTIGGPRWVVPLGRRDGLTSSKQNVGTIPLSNSTFSTLLGMFQKFGFTENELVILSGAHTIGQSHCTAISDRIYNFTGTGKPDPTLDPTYRAQLMMLCKQGDHKTQIPLDATQYVFDTNYYIQLQQNRGLLVSDMALVSNRRSKLCVTQALNATIFYQRFGAAMTKMSMLGVLTGSAGEIRTNCRAFNM